LNQLTETLTKNYKVSFTYDAEGLRTGKTVNGEKTVYVWDGDQVVMELSKGGAVQKRYIRGNDLVYADKGENTEKTYYVTDMHGNVVQLLDESGNVTKTYEYDSFGNEVKPEKKDENPYRYCGEYYDKETEEVYLRARYYQPSVGRFITRDTYTGESDEPLSLHLYTYCENDGVNAWDPSGHKIKLATKSKKKKKKILTTLYKLTGNKLKIMNKGHYKGYVLFKKAAFSPPLKYPKSMDLVISIMISNKICKITYDTKKGILYKVQKHRKCFQWKGY
jgi:YD repeat protein